MVSRRRILSRSRDELHSAEFFTREEEQSDIWISKERLYQDHIQEVLDKWESIDDEIWAKVIVLERNRRVAKAYARAPVLTVNGSDDGFDGFRIGVAGFDNPMRDPETVETIRHIGQGFKLKMDDVGNILIKRVSKASVRVKNTNEESAVSNDILKLPNAGALELDKPFRVFDMKKFQQNMNRELKRPYPDRLKLETQCISVVSFGSASEHLEILECPIWIICLNIVAIEMLRAKLPSASPRHLRPRSMEPRSLMPPPTGAGVANAGVVGPSTVRPFGSGSSDEDPYSVAGSGSSGSSGNGNGSGGNGNGRRHLTAHMGSSSNNNMGGSSSNNINNNRSRSRDKPPKLPPRDNAIYGPNLWAKSGQDATRQSGKFQDKKGDDPYYCGLRARIPNFVKSKGGNGSSNISSKKKQSSKMRSQSSDGNAGGALSLPPQIPTHPFWWHSRLYSDSGHTSLIPPSSDSTTSSSATPTAGQANGKGHYKRNPTNFVPYITANGTDYSDDISY